VVEHSSSGGRSGRRRSGGRRSGSKRDRSVDLERYRSIIPEWEAFSEAIARPEPTVFRVRTGRITEADLIERLAARGFRTRPLEGLPSFHQVEDGPVPVSLTPEHWLGLIYVQQASTGVAAPQVDVAPGERVLDLCSAPGGKTTHMAELMHDTGCLVASEISEPRIRGLLGNVYRLGHPNILVVAGDGRHFPEGPRFDRVLVDAPCSGEGTLRRRGGKPPDQSPSFLGYVTGAQRALLEKAVRVTRPGGTILYVTCTFSPEENEAVVSRALRTLPVELEPLELPVPHSPGLTSFAGTTYDRRLEGAARIYPHHLDSGGLFLAKLRRLDDGTERDSAGWSTVPATFPGGGGGAGVGTAGGDVGTSAADVVTPAPLRDTPATVADTPTEKLASGVDEIVERFGVTRDLSRIGWVMRGGRGWMHSVEEWPIEAWEPGGWRPISVGFRALDFDSRGRPRPTNDLLRWLGSDITRRVTDVDDAALRALLQRQAVATDIDERGPIALRWHGDVVGRGAVTVDGLKNEVPKARAADLLRIV
jgi:NOL1/NOP2/sun family putative RNA methylase